MCRLPAVAVGSGTSSDNCFCCLLRPSGLKYEKAREWKIPCVNAQWLCDILLGNFEALRQIQHSRYSIYTHPEPLQPNLQLVQNLLGMSQPGHTSILQVRKKWLISSIGRGVDSFSVCIQSRPGGLLQLGIIDLDRLSGVGSHDQWL